MKLEFHISMTAAEVLDLVTGRHAPLTPRIRPTNGNSKAELIRSMILRPRGVTAKEAERATGWRVVNIPAYARKGGIEIKREKENGHTRYFGINPKAPT